MLITGDGSEDGSSEKGPRATGRTERGQWWVNAPCFLSCPDLPASPKLSWDSVAKPIAALLVSPNLCTMCAGVLHGLSGRSLSAVSALLLVCWKRLDAQAEAGCAIADYLPSLGAGSQKSSFGLWTKYLQLKSLSASWASR